MATNAADDCPKPPDDVTPVDNLVGLALSGGGIRSASFNLGLLQGLASRKALWIFDYLSTVSGGGFTGSWWSAWLSREKRTPGDIFPADEELEAARRTDSARLLDSRDGSYPVPSIPDGSLIARRHDPINFVRLFSNYLTPKKGFLSPDTWRLVSFFVRNLLFTWLALLPLALAAVMLAQAFYLGGPARTAFLRDNVSSLVVPVNAADPTLPATRADSAIASARADSLRTENAASRTARLERVRAPILALLAVFGTLSLLWLAHASASFLLALAVYLTVIILALMVAPVFGDSGMSTNQKVLFPVVILTVAYHAAYYLTHRKRKRHGSTDVIMTATAADVRGWLAAQQATVLKVTVIVALVLFVAGFGHDIVWYLFTGGDSVLERAAARAGGWGALLLAVASSAYTAAKSAPSSDGSVPAASSSRMKAVAFKVAPLLAALVLLLFFAGISRRIMMAALQHPNSAQMTGAALLALAGMEFVFAIFESYHDPDDVPPAGAFWTRFIPALALGSMKSQAGAESSSQWYYLFAARGWARMAGSIALGAIVWAYGLPWQSPRSLSYWIAIGIPVATLLVTLVPRRWRVALASARPSFLLALACGSATLCISAMAVSPDGRAYAPLLAVVWVALLVGAVVGIGWLANPNLLSIHGFYKARLTRAWLGASNTARSNESVTDAAPGDDIPLCKLSNHDAGAPYHLINTTLNLVGGSDLAMSQRSAENFVMTRDHCGSARAGYRCTAAYMAGQVSLGTAAAISGAAASPTMGSKSPSAALTLLLSLLNVRLGYWAPNPSGRRWNEPQARLWPFYLLRETLANVGQLGTYCYLTDGGHFDNTGLYALVERGCRFIVISDCGADPKLGFEDIGTAIRRCRIDFGAEIDLVIDGMTARDSTLDVQLADIVMGRIRYNPEHLHMLGQNASQADGVVMWLKPSVTARNAADVRQYKRASPNFPQQSTADQWYDESQFESYRRLGYEIARHGFPQTATGADPIPPGSFQSIEAWFNNRVGMPAAVGAGAGTP